MTETGAHWLLWDTTAAKVSRPVIVWDADIAEQAGKLGRKVDGPFTLPSELPPDGVKALEVARAVMRVEMRADDRMGLPFNEDMADALKLVDLALGRRSV